MRRKRLNILYLEMLKKESQTMKVLGHKTNKGRVCYQTMHRNFFSDHGGDITSLVRDDIACVVYSIGSHFVTT